MAPCPTAFGRRNRLGDSRSMIRLYNQNSVIRNGVHPDETIIEEGKRLVLGKFVDTDRPTYLDRTAEPVVKEGTMWPRRRGEG